MKRYKKPIFNEITVDNRIVLMQTTQPFEVSSSNDSDTSSSDDEDSTDSSTKENNFDENPFQR